MPKVFLDKLVTSAHFPPAEGSRGYCSTTIFPDLSHTMLSTSFCPPKTTAMTPKGQMTQIFKQHAFRRYQTCERGAAEARHVPKFFKRAANVFNNKVLMDLEQMKLTRNDRRAKLWTAGKAEHGFASLDSQHDGGQVGGMMDLGSMESMDGIPRGASHSMAATPNNAYGRPATTQGEGRGGREGAPHPSSLPPPMAS